MAQLWLLVFKVAIFKGLPSPIGPSFEGTSELPYGGILKVGLPSEGC